MRKILLALLLFCAAPVNAQIINTLPFQLQNNTTADATQVMADFNQIVNNTNSNAAKNGVNSDITSLIGLTTPLNHIYGGSNVFTGGTSTGTNTIAVTPVSPTTFVLTNGVIVTFVAGGTNTGAATLNVSSSGAVNLYRRTTAGALATAGYEVVTGNIVTALYDGTQWQIIGDGLVTVGEMKDFTGTTAPNGTLFTDGSCQLRATYPALFAVLGTTWDPTGSTCDVNNFALPDFRGRVTAFQDTMGTNGAASRITNAGSGCVGTTIGGAGCGSQNQTLTIAQLPVVTPAGTISSVVTGGVNAGSTGSVINPAGVTTVPSGLLPIVVTSTFTGTPFGGGTAHPLLNPLQIATKVIKF